MAGTFKKPFKPGQLDSQIFIVVAVNSEHVASVEAGFIDGDEDKARQAFELKSGLRVLYMVDLATFRARAIAQLAAERVERL
jgi:hypothetical protein